MSARPQRPPALRFVRRVEPDPLPPPVPPLRPLARPGANAVIGGSWTGIVQASKAACIAKYGYVDDDPVGWEFVAGKGPAGDAAIRITWSEGVEGERNPTVTVNFIDAEVPRGTSWTASSLTDMELGPDRIAISADRKTVTFAGAGVAAPASATAGEEAIAKISTVTMSGTITCDHLDLSARPS